MSEIKLEMSPYENYLHQTLEIQKKRAEELALKYPKSRGLGKMMVKRELDRLNENIQILSRDLDKYADMVALDWLREPTKERDEKAEHLKPVPADAIGGATKATAPTPGSATAKAQPQGRPQIGTPTGGRPVIGQPPGSAPSPQVSTLVPKPTNASPAQTTGRPRIGSPVGRPIGSSPSPAQPQTQTIAVAGSTSPQVKSSAPTQTGARPKIGTPIGQTTATPRAKGQAAEQQKVASEQTSENMVHEANEKSPAIGTPIAGRPRVGKPIARQKDEQKHEDSEPSG
jgi:hypothetical protein